MEAVFRHGRAHTLNVNMLLKLLAILILSKLSTCCYIFENQLGNVTDDQDIEVGSGFTYHCNLFEETIEKYNVTAKDLILTQNSQPITDKVIVLNNYTIEFALDVSNLNDTGFYQCYVPVPDYPKPQLVCGSKVDIGTAPTKVSNFSCIGYGLRNITCSWTNPKNAVKTKYVLYDYLNNDDSDRRLCPERTTNSCTFTLESRPNYLRQLKYLNFLMFGSNKLGNLTQHFSIKHFEIVKPNPVAKASFKDVTKNSMVLVILAPKGVSYGEYAGGLIYEVKYHSVLPVEGKTMNVSIGAVTNAEYEFRNLVPYTLYRFEVRCRLNNTGGSYYISDEVIVTELTKPDVPYLAPKVDPSGFDLMTFESDVTINLYWEAIPLEFENGEGLHYLVKYHEHYVPHRFRRDSEAYVDVGKNTSYAFRGLSKDSAYIFTIVAANNEGLSFNRSDIVVDKAKKLLPGPKDIQVVKHNSGLFDITWKSPDLQPDNYSVAICETPKARPDTCDGPILFKKYGNARKQVSLMLDARTNYQFAVASVTEERTSGLHWAPCYATYGILYGVKTLQVMPKTSTSLKVSWTYPCPSAVRVVKEVEIAMCPSPEPCSESELHPESFEKCIVNGYGDLITHAINNGSLTETIVDGLQPFTHYLAVLRARTDGGWGQYSNAECESTMPSAPSDVPTHIRAEVNRSHDPMHTSILVFFKLPQKPNGIITRHVILYNNTFVSGDSKEKEVRVHPHLHQPLVLEKLGYHANYSIQVKSCVEQACSNYSKPVYVYTGVSTPGVVNLPRVEMQKTYVNISWDPPVLANGPIDFYQVLKMNNDSEIQMIYNVTGGETFLVLEQTCGADNPDTKTYDIMVRAVNVRDEVPLLGEFSSPLQTMLCASDNKILLYVGIVIGVGLLTVTIVFSLYFFIKCFTENMKNAKHTKIQLPIGMDYSMENPLNTYDKFKGGLKSSHDSGIPYEKGYECFFTDQTDGKTTEAEPPSRTTGRNLSGESDLSSAHTTKTHNSIDSGAEVESPPSPSSSANTTPRGYKLAQDILDEAEPRASTDSGLENHDLSWLVPPCNYILRGDTRSLSNSEPSLADFEVDSEPLVVARSWSCSGLAKKHDPTKNAGDNSADQQVMSVGGMPTGKGRDPYSLVGVEETSPYCIPLGDLRRTEQLLDSASQDRTKKPDAFRMAGGCIVFEQQAEPADSPPTDAEAMENMIASLNLFMNSKILDIGDGKGDIEKGDCFPMDPLPSPPAEISVPKGGDDPQVVVVVSTSDAAQQDVPASHA